MKLINLETPAYNVIIYVYVIALIKIITNFNYTIYLFIYLFIIYFISNYTHKHKLCINYNKTLKKH